MRQNILKWFLFLGLCLAAFGCSPSSNDQPHQKRFGRLSYDIGDCQRSPFDGADLMGPVSNGTREPLRLFGKEFYPEGLEKALPASSYSIAKTLFQEGVEMLQVKSLSNADLSCRYFDFLPEAKGLAQNQWNQVAKPSGTGNTLLGLFTTIYSKNNQTKETRLKNPTIMLIDQTQKWTLLHEMSHYLFAKARSRQKDLKFNSQLEQIVQEENSRIINLRNQLKQHETESIARQLTKSYQRFFKTNFILDKRTALEEFAVEGILIDYAKQNRISNIDVKSEAFQAYLYMKRNGEDVAFSYVIFLDRLRDLKAIIEKHQWGDAITPLNGLMARVRSEVDFINREIEAAYVSNDGQPSISGFLEKTGLPLPHFDMQKFRKRHRMLRH